MILKTIQDDGCGDIEVTIRYGKPSRQSEQLIAMIRTLDIRVSCRDGERERLVNASDIFYIESVDKRTFVYMEKSVFLTDHRLYQLENELASLGFVRISKACVININALDSIKPLINSRMEATLKNGERLYITRKYLDNIRNALKEARI